MQFGNGYALVLVFVMTMVACRSMNNKIEHLNSYVNYVRKSNEVDEEVCRQPFVDKGVRDQFGSCNALVFFSSVCRKRMDEGVSLVVEEVRAADTELDFGESITEREVYRIIFNGKIKSDTTYLLVGDHGIKSCAMVMKGKRVFWLQ
ncbi:hypothetical protein SAMN04488109_4445 [Chryseolinea serpens]|uniref:Uncharacterized protein n=2 Tax=Chryseolinea serpens TaxID=947013 RepID=A0A1M5U3Z7_9BACT|nr:hypothetical protein SAMN04488109_4445 [Chryseolinea serpens]